jgi:biopolymer transport protein ExbD
MLCVLLAIMSSSSSERDNRDQIPSGQNEDQTQRTAEKQSQVSGERRDKEVRDFPGAAAIGQALIGLEFPAGKNEIIQHVQQQSQNNLDYGKVVPILEKIQDKQYSNVAEITQAAGLVQ